jgi:TonB family protein
MNSYLEQGDYKRAQDFLNEFYEAQKPNKPDTSAFYFSVAGQVVKGAKNQLERYRALGLSVSDRNLPLEAIADIEKMRETLELVVTQSRALGKEKTRTSTAMAMIEEASNTRSSLARDDYDARRWKDETADAREEIANSRSVIMNAVNDSTGDTVATVPPANSIAANIPASADKPGTGMPEPVVFKPVSDSSSKPSSASAEIQKDDAGGNEPERRIRVVGGAPKDEKTDGKNTDGKTAGDDVAREASPLDMGSLISYATRQAQPIYPPAARNMRMTGLVKVEVVVDENGEVSEVQTMTGPSMLQSAAKDAIRKWRFKPFVRDGQPVKATGFVNFNFAL